MRPQLVWSYPAIHAGLSQLDGLAMGSPRLSTQAAGRADKVQEPSGYLKFATTPTADR